MDYEDIAIARLSTMTRFNEAQTEQSRSVDDQNVSKRHAHLLKRLWGKCVLNLTIRGHFMAQKYFRF